jgi:hypothetical protein
VESVSTTSVRSGEAAWTAERKASAVPGSKKNDGRE